MKYTPGPWGIAYEKGKIIVIGSDSARRGVCLIPNDEKELLIDEKLANATLISCAPELLEALEKEHKTNEENNTTGTCAICNLIKRAKGGRP